MYYCMYACNYNGKEINDLKPVALTSILSKCMDRVVCNQLVASVADRMDPLQFSYKAKSGMEDACLVLLNTIVSHLHIAGMSVSFSWIFHWHLIRFSPICCSKDF